MNKLHFYLISLFSLVLSSCGSDYSSFEDKADQYCKSDSEISASEIDNLSEEIKLFEGDRKFRKFFTDGSFDRAKLLTFLEKNGCNVADSVESPLKAKSYFINIYIENSGSMNGYVNGNTEFKNAIRDLFVLLKYNYGEKNISVNFINSAIYPTAVEGDIVAFSKALNTKTFKVGNTNESNINDIFKQVLSKTSKDTIAILLSDLIYSIGGGETESLLSDQKSLTKDAFLTKFKKNEKVATSVIKLNSAFNGNYYDKNNKRTMLDGVQRPYYITIVGSNDFMDNFNSKIKFDKSSVAGFENRFNLSLKDYSQNLQFSVVNTDEDAGRYRPNKAYTQNGVVKGIEAVSVDRNSNFIFSVALDLSQIPVEDSYILNKENYFVKDANYKILAIHPYSDKKIKANSLNMIKRNKFLPTHYIVFQAAEKSFNNLNFTLEKRLPKWVSETSTTDDTDSNLNKNKTFGIKYLIEGINEAYNIESKHNNYFELNLDIKK